MLSVANVVGSSRSGSCRGMASRLRWRGCHPPKRAEVRHPSRAAMHGAEVPTPLVPVGRCTAPPSLPHGRGWGVRIRYGVTIGVALTRADVLTVVRMPMLPGESAE